MVRIYDRRTLAWFFAGSIVVSTMSSSDGFPKLSAAPDQRATREKPGARLKSPELSKSSRSPKKASKRDRRIEFFRVPRVVRLEISIEKDDIAKLERSPREYVRAVVSEGGYQWRDVGIHLKGQRGSFQGIHGKPALTLNFDKFVKKQRFHGLDKFHLNNSVQDRSYLCEYACSEIFRSCGLPASRVTHATVKLNGFDLGLYVLREGCDRKFLSAWFYDTSGNLYDGGFCRDIDEGIEKRSGADDESALKELIRAVDIRDDKKRRAAIAKIVDVPQFLKFVALETLTVHWDGYARKANNYKVYHDPKTSRFVFIPWGMDQMFRSPYSSLEPRMRAVLARRVMSDPEWRAGYVKQLPKLAASVDLKALLSRMQAIEKMLKAEDPNVSWDAEDLVSRVRDRFEYVRAQSKAESEPK
ncbi:MAG: CotH kinase family protein [Planctomycetota bacterium]